MDGAKKKTLLKKVLKNLKKIKKTLKNVEKTVDKGKRFVLLYTSCRGGSQAVRAVARFKKIKNGIRKK